MTKKELVQRLNELPGSDNECVIWISANGLYFDGEVPIKSVLINNSKKIELILEDVKNA